MRALALAAHRTLRASKLVHVQQGILLPRRNFSDFQAKDLDDEFLDSSDALPESGRATKFRLAPGFVDKFRSKAPPFGFNGLGEFVYATRYSRVMPDGSKEQWYQTVERVVNGTYSMQKRWIDAHDLGWNPRRAQKSAQEMYERIFASE